MSAGIEGHWDAARTTRGCPSNRPRLREKGMYGKRELAHKHTHCITMCFRLKDLQMNRDIIYLPHQRTCDVINVLMGLETSKKSLLWCPSLIPNALLSATFAIQCHSTIYNICLRNNRQACRCVRVAVFFI